MASLEELEARATELGDGLGDCARSQDHNVNDNASLSSLSDAPSDGEQPNGKRKTTATRKKNPGGGRKQGGTTKTASAGKEDSSKKGPGRRRGKKGTTVSDGAVAVGVRSSKRIAHVAPESPAPPEEKPNKRRRLERALPHAASDSLNHKQLAPKTQPQQGPDTAQVERVTPEFQPPAQDHTQPPAEDQHEELPSPVESPRPTQDERSDTAEEESNSQMPVISADQRSDTAKESNAQTPVISADQRSDTAKEESVVQAASEAIQTPPTGKTTPSVKIPKQKVDTKNPTELNDTEAMKKTVPVSMSANDTKKSGNVSGVNIGSGAPKGKVKAAQGQPSQKKGKKVAKAKETPGADGADSLEHHSDADDYVDEDDGEEEEEDEVFPVSMSVRQEKLEAPAREQVARYLQNPKDRLSDNVRTHIRSRANHCPDAATSCFPLARDCLITGKGSLKCVYHLLVDNITKKRDRGGLVALTGVPYPPRRNPPTPKGQPEPASAYDKCKLPVGKDGQQHCHCGCAIDDAVWGLLLWKTGRIQYMGRVNGYEFTCNPPTPAQRNFEITRLKSLGFQLDDFFTHELDEGGKSYQERERYTILLRQIARLQRELGFGPQLSVDGLLRFEPKEEKQEEQQEKDVEMVDAVS
ncbi:hypothetical protein V5O48_015632 [Marasmius crinis-equi]|uniref:Uncharacterized protein n=1 Tax=Marasmius crinis-equi TaxID=585013 RepID=A0ABR3EU20_9AGAR